MALYSYLMDHDFGLAPNPFGQYCTLAVCKPVIRKSSNLHIGDWIIGTGSKALESTSGKKIIHHLIYVMQVSEIITMQEYWEDPRFQYKKPVLNGPLVAMYGDNFYHQGSKGNWIQEKSAHSNGDGSVNEDHLNQDVGGENVLIATLFYYFGDNAPLIPENFRFVCHTTQGHKRFENDEIADFIKWLKENFSIGINGDPINWVEYNQRELF